MKKTKTLFIGATLMSIFAFTLIQRVNWKVKEGYSVKFNGGTFKGLKALIQFNENNPENSKITASIDARTIDTGNRLMDEHAKDSQALDAGNFPMITFVSTSVKKNATGYEATGNLTLKGVTKEVKLPFTFDSKKALAQFPFHPKETFRGVLAITPNDYNIKRAGVPDQVSVELIIPVTR
ncbi:MAG: YceI family protein [Bacteroidota bacterium]